MKHALKWLSILLVVAVLGGCGALERVGGGKPAFGVAAELDLENGVAFVDPAFVGQVAQLWRVEDAAAAQWTVSRPGESPVRVNVIKMRPKGLGANAVTVHYGCKCTGNAAPGSDNTPCMRSVNVAGSQRVVQNVGYSFCEPSNNANDVCESKRVQVGDWIYYKDPACQTEVRRVPFTRGVCFPGP
jgi:hypothetical protein